MVHVIPSVIIAIVFATFAVWIARIVLRQRATWRQWCERPQTTDDVFIRACGLPEEDGARQLALAAREACAQVIGVPPGTINADDPLKHPIWDSLDWLDVIFRIERSANVKIPGGTLNEVLDARHKKVGTLVIADFVRAIHAHAQRDVPDRKTNRRSRSIA